MPLPPPPVRIWRVKHDPLLPPAVVRTERVTGGWFRATWETLRTMPLPTPLGALDALAARAGWEPTSVECVSSFRPETNLRPAGELAGHLALVAGNGRVAKAYTLKELVALAGGDGWEGELRRLGFDPRKAGVAHFDTGASLDAVAVVVDLSPPAGCSQCARALSPLACCGRCSLCCSCEETYS